MNDLRASVYFQIAEHFDSCSTGECVQKTCERTIATLGFDYYELSAYFPAIGKLQTINNYPEGWKQLYADENFVSKDPIVKHCWTHSTPLLWDEIEYSKGRVRAEERRVMSEAKKFQLNSGISIPVHGAGTEGSVVSFCSTEKKLTIDVSMRFGLQVIAQAQHDCIKRVAAADDLPCIKKELTAREKECLGWTAAGKTSWEISQILRLSESTITFHLKNAIDKMEVTNRSQAVAKALAHSQIMPF